MARQLWMPEAVAPLLERINSVGAEDGGINVGLVSTLAGRLIRRTGLRIPTECQRNSATTESYPEEW